jgi:carbon monoxide dehydrogenase subunit G
MIVEETFEVAAPVGYVYDQISDFGDIGYCVAGVQSVTVLNERESEWKIEQRFGAMARRFKLHATMIEAERPSLMKFTASSQDVDVSGRVEFEELEPNLTRCSMSMEIDVIGPLAPLVELFAKGPQQALIRKTVGNVRTKLETGVLPAGTQVAAVPSAAGADGTHAAAVQSTPERSGFMALVRAFFARLFGRGRTGQA